MCNACHGKCPMFVVTLAATISLGTRHSKAHGVHFSQFSFLELHMACHSSTNSWCLFINHPVRWAKLVKLVTEHRSQVVELTFSFCYAHKLCKVISHCIWCLRECFKYNILVLLASLISWYLKKKEEKNALLVITLKCIWRVWRQY